MVVRLIIIFIIFKSLDTHVSIAFLSTSIYHYFRKLHFVIECNSLYCLYTILYQKPMKIKVTVGSDGVLEYR